LKWDSWRGQRIPMVPQWRPWRSGMSLGMRGRLPYSRHGQRRNHRHRHRFNRNDFNFRRGVGNMGELHGERGHFNRASLRERNQQNGGDVYLRDHGNTGALLQLQRRLMLHTSREKAKELQCAD
jgi:hypothetical protein